jgi:hypothetical protein
MTEDENKEFNFLQLADDMSYKNWMYFKFLYNKKFKEAEDRIKELEAALREISQAVGDPAAYWIARAALGEKKDDH